MEDLMSLDLDSLHLSPEPLQLSPDDLIIAVMGVTGAGKSTFISHCTSGSHHPIIGHDITSCTSEVDVYNCDYAPGTSLYLVDTPGFNDTSRTDKQVLQNITEWLGTTYEQGVKLNGIVYFHPISDRRMTGSARKNLLMFSKLCGEGALSKVILATTMWENVDPADGELREKQLTETRDFWGFMCEKGSHIRRHYNNKESAMEILSYFARDKTQKVTLDVQRELVEGGKTLDETRVGKQLDSAFAAERERLKQELKQLEGELKETIRGQNEEMADLIRESQQEVRQEMETQIRQLQRDRDELKVTLDDLREQSRNAKANMTTGPSTPSRATNPSPSIWMPQHSEFHDATTRIRCGYAKIESRSSLRLQLDAFLTWSGNHFMFAIKQFAKNYFTTEQKLTRVELIQILPNERNSPHRIREQDTHLNMAEIGDDHNYIISGVNFSREGNSFLQKPADWFLQRCFRDYPRLASWIDPERDLDEKINQSGIWSGSLDDEFYPFKRRHRSREDECYESELGYDLSSEELKTLERRYGPRVHSMGSIQKRILAYPLRNRLTFLSLGPNGTYYARGLKFTQHPWDGMWKESSGYPPTSYELPQSLTSDTRMAEILTHECTTVWLGRHGSWVVHWPQWMHYARWNVKWHLNEVGLYPGLETFLRTYKAMLEETELEEHRYKYQGAVLTNLALDNSSNNWAAVIRYAGNCYRFYYNTHSANVFAELESQWNKRFRASKNPQGEKWRWVDVNDLKNHFVQVLHDEDEVPSD